MKVKFYLLLVSLFISSLSFGQWTQRSNFPGSSRAKSTSFTIGDKIYVLGGVDAGGNVIGGFFSYDIPSNTWQTMPAFPGPVRYGATSFVINGKGYVSTGGNDFGYLDDLWEYNPTTAVWTQKTSLPNGSAQHENQRTEAFSFVINGKAYLGGGEGWIFGANQTWNYAFFDLWEYNPANNSWTEKAVIPDFIGKDLSIGLSFNNRGYVGLGCNVGQTINYQSFWEYDAVADTWTAKTDFPSVASVDAGAFVYDSAIYVVGGVDLSNVSLSNQVYKYDIVNDTWTQMTPFTGGAIAGEFTAWTGTQAFIGTGYNGSIVPQNKLWEFTLSTGIESISNENKNLMSVYPNPSKDFISINSKLKINSADIIDLTGKLILSINSDFDRFNISELANGAFILKVKYSTGEIEYCKFIKD